MTDKAELKNAKLLYILMSVLLIGDWVVPLYFGVHAGFDFTLTRILNVVIMIYFCLNPAAMNHFLRSVLEIQMTPCLVIYMIVMVYTTVFRASINTFFSNFLDILTFYMVYYGIRYCIGIRKTVRWTVYVAWFLGIYGLIEYAAGDSLMLRYLRTVYTPVTVIYRSGQYRIMGPCAHSIGYGLLLLLLIAIICIDVEQDQLYLFRHPLLYVLLMLNVFLTGSRGPLALAILESACIVLFSQGRQRQKTLLLLGLLCGVAVVVIAAIQNTGLGRYIMMQLTSVIDEILGTSYAARYGADTTWLSQSSSYRDLLPRIFAVDWLNPLIGQGADAHLGFVIDGVYIKSIDNFYVALYIRYGYPGLISYVLFFLSSIYFMVREAYRKNSGLCMGLGIGMLVYCIGLYTVDYLQTTKYMYILVAIYAAYYSQNEKVGEISG